MVEVVTCDLWRLAPGGHALKPRLPQLHCIVVFDESAEHTPRPAALPVARFHVDPGHFGDHPLSLGFLLAFVGGREIDGFQRFGVVGTRCHVSLQIVGSPGQ